MKIKQYDKVSLKDGSAADIVEIFDGGKAFLADIDRKDGTETDWVKPQEIEKILDKDYFPTEDGKMCESILDNL